MAARTFNRCNDLSAGVIGPPNGGLAGAVPPASFVLDSPIRPLMAAKSPPVGLPPHMFVTR